MSNTRDIADFMAPEDIINLARYPISDASSKERSELVKALREHLDTH